MELSSGANECRVTGREERGRRREWEVVDQLLDTVKPDDAEHAGGRSRTVSDVITSVSTRLTGITRAVASDN